MHDLSGFRRDLLAIIAEMREGSGLQIKEAYQDHYNLNNVNHGRLYPNLDKLVEMGLIEKGQYDDRTNRYYLTQRGVSELESHAEWMSETVEGLQ